MRIERAMVGLELTRARRTHGSMIWLDFGSLEVVSVYGNDKEVMAGSAFHIIVEQCDWRLMSHRTRWLGATDHRDVIEKRLMQLVGRRARSAWLRPSGSAIRFSGGWTLRLPSGDRHESDMDHWMLFSGRWHIVSLGHRSNLDWSP